MEVELIIYVFMACMMVVSLNFLHKAEIVRNSDTIYSILLLSLIVIQILIVILLHIYPQTTDSIPINTPIYLGTLFALSLIYILTILTVSSFEIQEDARAWIGWTMFLVLAVSFFTLLIGLPESLTDLYRLPIALLLCIGMQYYSKVYHRFVRLKDAADNRTVERSVEGHKDVVINLAIESWRFAKNYERIIQQLDSSKSQRYKRQLEQFVKKAEESLSDVSLRLVNVEGFPYDPGIAATPLNIEDFEPDDQLIVDQMLEPIIMEGKVLAKTGTVILRRID